MSLVLFETTESVIEVLWDVALAFFVVRLSAVYFAATFLSWAALCGLAYWEVVALPLHHHLSSAPTEQQQRLLLTGILPALLVAASALAARLVVAHYDVPRVRGFRVSIGLVGLLLMVNAELLAALALYEEGYGQWLRERVAEPTTDLIWLAVLAAFAGMPAALMLFERETDEVKEEIKRAHGHEGKSIVDAV